MKRLQYASFAFTLLLLTACANRNPFAYADTPFDNAHVALKSFEIVQEEILPLVEDPALSDAAKEKLKTVSHDGMLASVQLGGGVTEVENARATLAEGQTTNERLEIANANLVTWTKTLQARIASIKSAAKEVRHEHQ